MRRHLWQPVNQRVLHASGTYITASPGVDEDDTYVPGDGFLTAHSPGLWFAASNEDFVAAQNIGSGDPDQVHLRNLWVRSSQMPSGFFLTHAEIDYAWVWWRPSDWVLGPITASGWAAAAAIRNDIESVLPEFPETSSTGRDTCMFHLDITQEGTPPLPSGTYGHDLTEFVDNLGGTGQDVNFFWNDKHFSNGAGLGSGATDIESRTTTYTSGDSGYERVNANSIVQSNLTIDFGASLNGANVTEVSIGKAICVMRVYHP